MPESVIIGAFVLGAVLLLIAVVGGRFKIFGAEVTGTAGRVGRAVAGVAGTALVVLGLFGGLPEPKPEAKETPSPTPTPVRERSIPISVSYQLASNMVDGRAVVFINGQEVARLAVDKNTKLSSRTVILPGPGSYDYSVQAQMTVKAYDANGNEAWPDRAESTGRGKIEVEAGKVFKLVTVNIDLREGQSFFYSTLKDTALE